MLGTPFHRYGHHPSSAGDSRRAPASGMYDRASGLSTHHAPSHRGYRQRNAGTSLGISRSRPAAAHGAHVDVKCGQVKAYGDSVSSANNSGATSGSHRMKEALEVNGAAILDISQKAYQIAGSQTSNPQITILTPHATVGVRVSNGPVSITGKVNARLPTENTTEKLTINGEAIEFTGGVFAYVGTTPPAEDGLLHFTVVFTNDYGVSDAKELILIPMDPGYVAPSSVRITAGQGAYFINRGSGNLTATNGHLVIGQSDSGEDIRSTLRFDGIFTAESKVPLGATIRSAELSLHFMAPGALPMLNVSRTSEGPSWSYPSVITAGPGSADEYGIDIGVSWLKRNATSFWNSQGGDLFNSRNAGSFTGVGGEALRFDVTSDVQAWSNGAGHDGWILRGYGGRIELGSFSAPNLLRRPSLIITYVN